VLPMTMKVILMVMSELAIIAFRYELHFGVLEGYIVWV